MNKAQRILNRQYQYILDRERERAKTVIVNTKSSKGWLKNRIGVKTHD